MADADELHAATAAISELRAQLSSLQASSVPLDQYSIDTTGFWLIFGCCLVFFMQTGFAMLEVGCVSPKNTKNILIKVGGGVTSPKQTYIAECFSIVL